MTSIRGRVALAIPLFILLAFIILLGTSLRAGAAQYAALVMDARTGKVLHSRNADTPLPPASLTKMMTLYVAFEAVQNGEIGLDTKVRISKKAANEVPSKLGLKAGQRIEFRYLIRGAAVKSANDAATAIAEAVSGSEAKFARRMNRTARALGMTRTTFKNAHGLTEAGHVSTARDMSLLGRHLFFDYPEYYNLFSRRTTDTKVRMVQNTNRKFLNSYSGADGIKTGYTHAAGSCLVASRPTRQQADHHHGLRGLLQRRPQRQGGGADGSGLFPCAPQGRHESAEPARLFRSWHTAGRNSCCTRQAGRGQFAPSARSTPGPEAAPVAEALPEIVVAVASASTAGVVPKPRAVVAGFATAPTAEPEIRDEATPAREASVPDHEAEAAATLVARAVTTPAIAPGGTQLAMFGASPSPRARPRRVDYTADQPASDGADAVQVVVSRISTSGGRHWGINVGRYPSRLQRRTGAAENGADGDADAGRRVAEDRPTQLRVRREFRRPQPRSGGTGLQAPECQWHRMLHLRGRTVPDRAPARANAPNVEFTPGHRPGSNGALNDGLPLRPTRYSLGWSSYSEERIRWLSPSGSSY